MRLHHSFDGIVTTGGRSAKEWIATSCIADTCDLPAQKTPRSLTVLNKRQAESGPPLEPAKSYAVSLPACLGWRLLSGLTKPDIGLGTRRNVTAGKHRAARPL